MTRKMLLRGVLSGSLATAVANAKAEIESVLRSGESIGARTYPYDPTGTMHAAMVEAAKQPQWPQQGQAPPSGGAGGASTAGGFDDGTTFGENLWLVGGMITDFRETLTALLLVVVRASRPRRKPRSSSQPRALGNHNRPFSYEVGLLFGG